jgi:hypothetical protein
VGTAACARCNDIVWRKVLLCLVLVSACTSAAPTAVSVPTAFAPFPTAPLPDAFADQLRVPAGTDLVYLERAWEPKDNLSVIGMPAGTLLRRIDTANPRALHVDRERGVGYYVHITSAGERTRAVIERIDLATGAIMTRIDAGEGVFGNGLYSQPRHHAYIDLSRDGRLLAVVRPGVNGDESATRIELFDTQSGASVSAATFPGKPDTTVDPSFVTVGRDRFYLDRSYLSGCASSMCTANKGNDPRIWLDAGLRTITALDACAGGRALPGQATQVNICGLRPTSLGFFDERALAELGRVALPAGQDLRYWDIARDGTISVITDSFGLVRIDGTRRTLMDVRPIRTDSSTWRLPFAPSVAFAKTPPPDPAAQFSPDGRLAYLTSARHLPIAHLLPEDEIAVVDLSSAAVIARLRVPGRVQGIHLSPDGTRLHALVAEGSDELARWLYSLDARDGRPLARLDVVGERYLRISTVATAP